MSLSPDEHAEVLMAALEVLDISWRPDAIASGEARAVMLATALLGAAEAHYLGAELDAWQAGVDVGQLREAFGPIRDEVVATTAPADPFVLILMQRAGWLLSDLSRAAGPDEQNPDDQAWAAARDAMAVVMSLIGYRRATNGTASEDEPDARQHLALASTALRQAADRLRLLAQDPGRQVE